MGQQALMQLAGEHRDAVHPGVVAEPMTGEADLAAAAAHQHLVTEIGPLLVAAIVFCSAGRWPGATGAGRGDSQVDTSNGSTLVLAETAWFRPVPPLLAPVPTRWKRGGCSTPLHGAPGGAWRGRSSPATHGFHRLIGVEFLAPADRPGAQARIWFIDAAVRPRRRGVVDAHPGRHRAAHGKEEPIDTKARKAQIHHRGPTSGNREDGGRQQQVLDALQPQTTPPVAADGGGAGGLPEEPRRT